MAIHGLHVLNDNPLLAFLGRRGRGAVVEALRRNAGRPLHVRELARLADVAPMVASRAVRELEALRAVEVARRGRELTVRLDAESRAGEFLARIEAPDPPFA
jgi:DNA-binding transcriptional regulator YhcF (GntR family)